MAAEKYVGKSVYSCGFNGFGQLPLVSSEMKKKRVVSLPQRCTCVPRHDIFLGSLALGWSCCVICEDKKIEINGFFSEQKTCLQSLPSASDIQSVHYYQGSVYALGSSCHGPLMLKDNMQLKEVKVEFKGHEESKIVTLDGTDDIFYVVSENRHLGKLEQHEASFIYQELFSDMPVEVISCGKEHVMLLTKGGSLYSFGSGSRGQLGHGVVQDKVDKPSEIEALSALRITGISCGGWHSAAVSEHNDLYIWGWNESGQLGFLMNSSKIEHLKSESATRREICTSPIGDIMDTPSAAGKKVEKDQHMSRSNKISTEDNSPITFLMSPQILDMRPQEETLIKKVSCGSRHTAAITQDGHLYTWGFGRWGQLGHGNEWTLDTPTRVESLGLEVKYVDVYCKEWNTFLLVEEPT